MGENAFCLDEYHKECDEETYIYIYNTNTPDICTTADNVEYYYIDD